MPVHYSGLPCKMDELLEIAKNDKIYIVEDSATSYPYPAKMPSFLAKLGLFDWNTGTRKTKKEKFT